MLIEQHRLLLSHLISLRLQSVLLQW